MTTAAMGLLVVIWTNPVGHDSSTFTDGFEAVMDTDGKVFMAAVRQLIDDPLADRYRRLIAIDITDSEDDFMDVIVPALTGPTPTTSRHPEKGVGPC